MPGPDVGAVVRDEDGQVAHDVNRSCVAGAADVLPLLEEQKLREHVQPDLAGAACGPARDRRRIAMRDVRLPCGPRRKTVGLFDGHEQREVVEPVGLCVAEAIEAIAHRARAGGVEAIEHARPERLAVGDDGGEVHAVCGT